MRRKTKINKIGVYDSFGSFPAVRKAYRRCRTVQHFILTPAAQKRLDPVCARCGKKLSQHPDSPGYNSNLSEYHPRTKTIKVYNYACAWGATLEEIDKKLP